MALRDKLMRRDLFEDFCREYVRELNRLRMEHRASLSSARHELAAVEREIRKLIQAIKDGVSALSIKDELLSLEARKAELQSRLEAPEMPELLHPRMADVYREKVGSLCLALESEESRTGAVEAIRALIEAIVLEPDGDQLKITLKGDLAGMLNAARDSKRSPDTGDLLVQIKLVAGARNRQVPTDFPGPDRTLRGGSVRSAGFCGAFVPAAAPEERCRAASGRIPRPTGTSRWRFPSIGPTPNNKTADSVQESAATSSAAAGMPPEPHERDTVIVARPRLLGTAPIGWRDTK